MRVVAEDALRSGDPRRALEALTQAVRATPTDATLRVFLFQLLCVLGQWDRALTQLEVCAQLDASALPMRETYRDAVRCESVRAQVFAGQRSPLLFGEPEAWTAQLIEALVRDGRGDKAHGAHLRDVALASATIVAGTADGRSFEGVSDADPRLGPVLEAVINGRYYWVPYARLASVQSEVPSDLRDTVWLPANLQFANGGEAIALLPVRYPGSDESTDGLVALARKTTWEDQPTGPQWGLGQRLLATDTDDIGFLDVRKLTFDTLDSAAPEPGADSVTSVTGSRFDG